MRRIILALALTALAGPAFAQSVPGKGQFGAGVTFAPLSAPSFTPNGGVLQSTGLNGRYWVDNQIVVLGGIQVSSLENVGTSFGFDVGAEYHIPYGTKTSPISPFVGGVFGLGIVSPTGGNSTVGINFGLGGGLEYYFSKHFTFQLSEGLALFTKPVTAFALVTQLGINWYL